MSDAVLTALADPTRRRIFEALREGPDTVKGLAARQPVSRPAVSQHLKVLEQAGLAGVNPVGKRRFYYIRREGLEQLREYVESFWTDALSAYATEVERRVNSAAQNSTTV
ncbi:MAG: metalloregulator ArsR/SmtB family transcription factor [Gemmatimonadaceae bacterium]